MAGKYGLTAAVVFFGLGWLLGPGSAAGALVTVKAAEGFDPAAIKTVAFLPLVRVLADASGERAECPLGKETFVPCRMEDAAEAELSRAIGQALLASGVPVRWTPQAEINAARARLKQEGHPELGPEGSWQLALGREVGADAVLLGFIFCYRDRSGGALASASPAAIGFCLHLVDPAGRVLWSLRYEDEQKPLSDNLLELRDFIKRKGRWVSVQVLAEEAGAAAAARLPWKGAPKATGRLGP